MKFSLCICAGGKIGDLENLFKSIFSLNNIDLLSEILIIDNHPKKEDSEKVFRIIKNFESGFVNIKYIYEENLGVACARNRALRESKEDIILFVDDDCIIHKDWLKNTQDVIKDFPRAAFFAGRVVPIWRGDFPGWLKDYYKILFPAEAGYSNLGNKIKIIKSKRLACGILGANFVLNKEIINPKLLYFDPELGHKPYKYGINLGEETELMWRLVDGGYFGVYAPKTIAYHINIPEKKSWGYFQEHKFMSGILKERYYLRNLKSLKSFDVFVRKNILKFLEKITRIFYGMELQNHIPLRDSSLLQNRPSPSRSGGRKLHQSYCRRQFSCRFLKFDFFYRFFILLNFNIKGRLQNYK